jgi:aminoglycoside 6'-N-acetyltransferase I
MSHLSSRIAVGEDGLVLVLCQGSCDVVADLEERVKERGGLTITLGTDDVNYQTSLAGIDLFPNVWEYVVNIRNLKQHPFEFYQKQGYVIVGVMPDANGPGKPDILMAKSVVS